MSIRRASTSTLRDKRNYPTLSTGVAIGWADISAATVAPATYNDGSAVWRYYKFTTTGTITFGRAGYVDLLVVGGGGNGSQTSQGGFSSTGGGGAGAVRWGVFPVNAGTLTVTVGAGAVGALNAINTGGTSSFGDVLKAGGGRAPRLSDEDPIDRYTSLGGGGSQGGVTSFEATRNDLPGAGQGGTVWGSNVWDGITLNYDGTSRVYGAGGRLNVNAEAFTGSGGREGIYNGADGVIIVKVRVA